MFSGQYSVDLCLLMMRDMPHNGEKEGRQGRVNIWQSGLEDSKSGQLQWQLWCRRVGSCNDGPQKQYTDINTKPPLLSVELPFLVFISWPPTVLNFCRQSKAPALSHASS